MSTQAWDDLICAVCAGGLLGLIIGWLAWAPVY